jgi:hypothetical protein
MNRLRTIMAGLTLGWSGADALIVSRAADRLLRMQGKHGGCSQLPWLPSGAYATGQALYVLLTVGGLSTESVAFRKGLGNLRAWPNFALSLPRGADQ